MQAHKPTALRFVELLTGDPTTPVNVRLLSDKDKAAPAEKLFGSIDDLWPRIEAAPADGRGVFVVVNEGGDKAEDIWNVRALFVDGDDIPMPTEWHQKPSWLVARGPERWHAYWRVNDCSVSEFSAAQRRLIAQYGTDPAVHDLSRVMRLPGTLHVKGEAVPVKMREGGGPTYRPTETILAGLPEPLAKSADARQAGNVELDLPANVERAAQFLATQPDMWPGDDAGLQVAFKLRDLGLSAERSVDLMEDRWNPSGNQEWSAIVARKVENAWSYAQNSAPGVDAVARVGDLWSADTLGKIAAATQPEQPPPPPPFRILSLKDIDALPDPEFLIEDILVEGENSILAGQMKSAKTFVAIEYAMCVATGLPVFGTQAVRTTGPVVYFGGEGLAGFHARTLAWRLHRGAREAPFFLVDRVPLASAGGEELSRWLDAISTHIGRAPVLTVIDTMSRATGDMKEDNLAGSLYLAMAEAIHRRFGGTFLSLAHFGKTADLGVRGHTSAAAGVDANWKIERKSAVRELFKLDLDNGRNTGHLGPYYLGLRHVETGLKMDNGYVLEQLPSSLWTGVVAEDPFAGPKIHALLAAHPGFRATDDVLAGWMTPRRENQPEDEWRTELQKTRRAIQKRAGRDLAGYVVQQSPRLWGLRQ